ncbi:MAG: hypothetical protein HYV35_00880 [Lentisphaerae bacterium]|nr:hypothetical protein [Lentisphaerota bacterium]
MKFLKYFFILHSAFCILFLAGCEWDAGSSVTSWDDSGNWVDFSGTYKASDGNVLVRQFGVTNALSTTNITTATNTVSSELLATGNGTNTSFNGQLTYAPVRGSLTIFTVGGYQFTDSAGTSADTVSLSVTPADGSAGTLNYLTRAWALTFPAPIANGTQILATYLYVSTVEVVTPIQGNHGDAIYSFVVYQTGNKLQIGDSNGAGYEGTIGTVRTTGGQPVDLNASGAVLPSSGPVVAQFSATGVANGYKVTLVGVLQGTLNGTTLSARTMQATFIEEAGSEAAVTAVAQ